MIGYGGLEQIAYQCAKGLAARGHQVTLVAPDGSSCPGGQVFSIGPPGQGDESASYSKYWKLLLEQDCVIDHTWQKNSLLLRAEHPERCPPCLAVLHAPVDTMLKTLPPGVAKPCFVCISDDQRNHFENLFDARARTCHNGIDPNFYRSLGMNRTNRFLFLARYSTIKGPHLAIDACKAVGASLDMVGDTSITNEPALFEYCKSHADNKQIRIVGGVSRSETLRWFSSAFCFLHPNKYFREPLGLAPLEAQACGLPVIAWRKGAMTETIKQGETGWLVENETQLAQMVGRVGNEGISDAMRQSCREWVCDNFTEERMIGRYEELCIEARDTGGW